MQYRYYITLDSNEHMLYADEIAALYNIYSNTNKHHGRLVKALILDYLEERGIKYMPINFLTKYGMKEVFPAHHYVPALERILLEKDPNKTRLYMSLDGKKYKYIIK